MLKIALSGCTGRMGRVISEMVAARDDMKIVAGFALDPEKIMGYPVYLDPLEYTGSADVLVDFSNPAIFGHVLDYCVGHGTPLLLATTGHNEEQLERLRSASERIAVFKSPNMSFGVAVLGDLARRAAKILGGEFDIEIIERHHNKKVDAPSGTALSLAAFVSGELDSEPELVYDRHDRRAARGKNEIGMHALRGGTIVGEHEIVFAGSNETISLTHTAQSREVFAAGAIYAAKFLAGRAPGIYDMRDLLESF